jgi:hypothetical protein
VNRKIIREIQETNQHLFIEKSKIEESSVNGLYEVLNSWEFFVDLKWLQSEEEFLEKLYEEFIKSEKMKDIFEKEWITKEDFIDPFNTSNIFDDIQFHLKVWEVKIVLDNVESVWEDVREFINSIIAYRERYMVFVLIWDLREYTYFTWIEDMHIKEWDDYKKI